MALDLTLSGRTDAACYAALNKTALHLASMTERDEINLSARRIGYKDYFCEPDVFKEPWSARATSHIAIKDVS